MSFDETLANRIRVILKENPNIFEKNMFGGLVFMMNGHMCCGVEKNRLMARVGSENYKIALEQPFASEMDFTGKPLKGFVYVNQDGLKTKKELSRWVDICVNFISDLPPKESF